MHSKSDNRLLYSIGKVLTEELGLCLEHEFSKECQILRIGFPKQAYANFFGIEMFNDKASRTDNNTNQGVETP